MATTDRILEIPTVEGLEFDDPTHNPKRVRYPGTTE